jgi:hypothetical protein
LQEKHGPNDQDRHPLNADRQRRVVEALRGALASME